MNEVKLTDYIFEDFQDKVLQKCELKNGLVMAKLLRAEKTERLDKVLCYLNTLHTLNYLYQFS